MPWPEDSDNPIEPQQDDVSFDEAMSGVTRIHSDRVDLRPKPKRRPDKAKAHLREIAETEPEGIIDGLSSEAVEIVESEQELLFAGPGIQLKVMQRLRRGHIPWDEGVDLHGLTVEKARKVLHEFIMQSHQQNLRTVLVVHGKAFSQSGRQPLLKSYTNDWLRQLPQVLAFCSAQPKDGGAGALYVLLRKPSR